jgi:hypothetical protein
MSSLKLVSSCFLLFASLCMGADGISQVDPYKSVSLVPPTAASLGKYADIPVNTHTGIPTISIPIYTAKLGSLEVPISLSYHAGGLKVMEVASWVGTGWSLNAGGVITRTVQGAPDEKLTSQNNSNQVFGYLSEGGFPNYLWYQNPSLPDAPILLKDIYEGKGDGEPDLFFFNFGGYNGKFYFGDDRIPVILPEQDIKIEYVYHPGIFKSIESFKLTTPDGIQYYFGMTPETDDVDPVERSLAFSAASGFGNEGRSISSWYLNKMVSADSLHEIKFTYVPDKFSYPTLSLSQVPYNPDNNQNAGVGYTQLFTEGVRLSNINFVNGNVQFNGGQLREDLNAFSPRQIQDFPNDLSVSLGDITITDNVNTCKKFIFTYDYFVDNVSPLPNFSNFISYTSDKKRLKLVSLQEKSCDNSTAITPYFFDYNEEFVPRRLSYSQDHWGFNNGITNATTLIPTITEYTNYLTGAGLRDIPGADREAHWPAMRAGAIKKITYPTGGSAEYEFEPNDTWLSGIKWMDNYRDSYQAGYTVSQPNPLSFPYTFTGHPYKFVLRNETDGGLANVSVNYPSGTQLFTLPANPGETKEITLLIPAGQFTVTLSKNNVPQVSGHGCSVTFFEKTSFTYSRTELVGGLRVKKTILHDGVSENSNIQTNYSYIDDNGRSTGILYSRPTYVQVLKNSGPRFVYQFLFMNGFPNYRDAELVTGEEPYFSINQPTAIMSPSPLLAMQTTQGSHIGYSEVKVSKPENGYSVYRFYGTPPWENIPSDVAIRTIDRSATPDAPEYPEKPLPYDYIRGDLKYEGHFTDAGKLLKEVTYYHTYVNSIVTAPGVKVYTETRSEIGKLSAKTDYELQSAKKTQEIVEEKIYDKNSNQYLSNTKTINFGSNHHSEVTKIETSNSKGESIVSENTYAFDYLPANCSLANTNWNQYQAALQSSLTLYGVENNACADADCRLSAKYRFYQRNMQARRDYSEARAISVQTFSNCITNAKSTADAQLKPILELRSKNMNALIETTNWKADKLTGAVFSVFDYSLIPNSQVYVKYKKAISLSSPSEEFLRSAVVSNTIAIDSRYETEAEYQFESGNLVNFKGRDGVENAFIWGYNNSIPIVKAVGVNYSVLKSAFATAGGNYATLRAQPGLSKAFVTTYQHNPLLGMLNEANPNSRETKYEYDPIFRLLRIRDHDDNILKQWQYQFYTPSCLPDWQNQGTVYCETLNGENTGYQLQLQRDARACSPSYNQTRIITIGYNPGACAINTICSPANCSGQGYKCINGTCELGIKVYTSSVQSPPGQWTCTYHYEWSDGTWSGNYTETASYNCSGIIQ